MGKFQHVVLKFETENELSTHSSVNTTSKYKLVKSYVLFLEEAMSLFEKVEVRHNEHNSVNDVISTFITMTGQPSWANPFKISSKSLTEML